jgi:pimeloyl-ACP methyl ester carboxylesterase
MSRRIITITASLAALLSAGAVVTASAHAATHSANQPAVHGLPADAPAALYRGEPALSKAAGWPGSNTAFSRTSGTGRLADGGLYWTDFLYDDHGTTTASTGGLSVTAGSPSFGTYTYPAGASHENGADIFRAAVLRRPKASYWRVDWSTLASARVPIAEWTFDRDDNAATGGSDWPAGAGVHSPGIDTALVMSSQGASIINVASGTVRRRLHVTVDRAAHSFVVRVPTSVLKPRGTWRIRLAAGLADAAGTGFARPADALPTQPAVYNVTFRSRAQEAPADNFWNDNAQSIALASGNVASFSHLLHWSALAHRTTTTQPRPTGWSDRWYVSEVNLGAGVVTSAASISDGLPNYLGRVQPYAIYVPKSYSPKRPAPLTFLLHSLTQNHNQYAATTPKFSALACEDRHSICVTTLGRGPDGNYFDDAELDFWQVWHQVATAYRVDPDRTILAGYSMGGIGTNQLAMEHPDLFAKAVTLAGAVGDVPSLHNLRWIPTYLAGGAEDELVPVTVEQAEAAALDALGDRYRWLLYPAIDHVSYELADSFADSASFMANARRVVNPGQFDFTWIPSNSEDAFSTRAATGGGISWTQLPKYGVGTTGDYWLRNLLARTTAQDASLHALSGARPQRGVKTHTTRNVQTTGGPEPGLATTLTWTRTNRPDPRAVIRLHLQNVRSLRVLLTAAGFRAGQHGKLRVTTDGPTTLRLGGRTVHIAKGSHVVPFVA